MAQLSQTTFERGTLPVTAIPLVKQAFRPSKWASRPKTKVRPRLLPFQFGNGKKEVVVSFFHAPEIELLVKFDSRLPLDLPDAERFKVSPLIRSFRDVLDDIYELAENHIPIRRSWSRIIEDGSNWCLA